MVVGKVAIRQREIPAHPPFFAPGVPHNETALHLFVTYREDGVAASTLVVANRHRSPTSVRDLFRVKALVDCKSENERITRGETSFHVRQCSPDAVVNQRRMFRCFDVTFSQRLLAKLPRSIRPQSLGTNPPFRDRFDAAADLRTAIGMN